MKNRSIFPLFFFLSAQLALGQTYTWNLGVNGSWDTTTPNWLGTGSTWVNGNTSNAVFGDTAVTVTANQAITANSIPFNSPGYTVQTTNGSLLTLSGTDASITANFSAGATVSMNLGFAGTNGLTKDG